MANLTSRTRARRQDHTRSLMNKLDPRRNFNPARRYRLRGKRAVAAVVSMCGLLVVGLPAVASLSATGASASGAPSANGENNKGGV